MEYSIVSRVRLVWYRGLNGGTLEVRGPPNIFLCLPKKLICMNFSAKNGEGAPQYILVFDQKTNLHEFFGQNW